MFFVAAMKKTLRAPVTPLPKRGSVVLVSLSAALLYCIFSDIMSLLCVCSLTTE
jgi:hypothetical protein